MTIKPKVDIKTILNEENRFFVFGICAFFLILFVAYSALTSVSVSSENVVVSPTQTTTPTWDDFFGVQSVVSNPATVDFYLGTAPNGTSFGSKVIYYAIQVNSSIDITNATVRLHNSTFEVVSSKYITPENFTVKFNFIAPYSDTFYLNFTAENDSTTYPSSTNEYYVLPTYTGVSGSVIGKYVVVEGGLPANVYSYIRVYYPTYHILDVDYSIERNMTVLLSPTAE